jgi:hypothetical protein
VRGEDGVLLSFPGVSKGNYNITGPPPFDVSQDFREVDSNFFHILILESRRPRWYCFYPFSVIKYDRIV